MDNDKRNPYQKILDDAYRLAQDKVPSKILDATDDVDGDSNLDSGFDSFPYGRPLPGDKNWF